MDLNDYQALAARTADSAEPYSRRVMIAALGLTGEAGEVAELVKKGIGHGHGIQRHEIAEELGDLLWYIAEMASVNELDLEAIAEQNISKLKDRYPDGFSTEASLARVDVTP